MKISDFFVGLLQFLGVLGVLGVYHAKKAFKTTT